MGEADKQFNARLIDEYYRLKDIRDVAVETNAREVVELVDKQLKRIKLKLQPLELPDED